MLDTILIVDSDKANLEMLEQVISEKIRYNVLSSSNVDEAIHSVLSACSIVKLMLLDMRLSCIEILRIIRTIRQVKPNFPIIIVTEYGEQYYATEAIKAGANDFLTRPVTMERLKLSVDTALRMQHLCNVITYLESRLAMGTCCDNNRLEPYYDLSLVGPDGKIKKLRTLEEQAIRYALNACGGSMSKAARSLGIGRSTLYRKVSEIERHNKSGKVVQMPRANQTTRPTTLISEAEHS